MSGSDRRGSQGMAGASDGPSPPPGLSLVPRDGWRPLPQPRGRGGAGFGALRRVVARDGEPPPSPALPHKLRGGGRCDAPPGAGSNFSSPPCSSGGGGRERGGAWRTQWDIVRRAPIQRLRSPLREVRAGGAGGGAPRRRSSIPVVAAIEFSPLPAPFAGEGPGMGDS